LAAAKDRHDIFVRQLESAKRVNKEFARQIESRMQETADKLNRLTKCKQMYWNLRMGRPSAGASSSAAAGPLSSADNPMVSAAVVGRSLEEQVVLEEKERVAE
ncbi:unnamed protein product, partial [Polarella glacialis]